MTILACAPELASLLAASAALQPTAKSLVALPEATRDKLLGAPARLSALLAKTPLVLPDEGALVSP